MWHAVTTSDCPVCQIIDAVEVADISSVNAMVAQIADKSIDVVINNAGYFPDIHETITEPANPLNFEEQLKQINICAVIPQMCIDICAVTPQIRTYICAVIPQNMYRHLCSNMLSASVFYTSLH